MLPNLIVIGAPKCGTTSLHYYLDLHPEIGMSRQKELNFFLAEDIWERGVQWYAKQFPRGYKVRGETSPLYTTYPIEQGVPKRMFSVVPDAKLIYVVRDPIKRIVSGYIHHYAVGFTNFNLAEALEDLEDNYFVAPSLYHHQLAQYLKYFPRSNILIVAQEDLLKARVATLRKIFRFLGVDDRFSSPGFKRKLHQSNEKRRLTATGQIIASFSRQISPSHLPRHRALLLRPFSRPFKRSVLDSRLEKKLKSHLRKDIARFRKTAGQPFDSWTV